VSTLGISIKEDGFKISLMLHLLQPHFLQNFFTCIMLFFFPCGMLNVAFFVFWAEVAGTNNRKEIIGVGEPPLEAAGLPLLSVVGDG
jgi:hypothetical protein